MDIKQKTRLFLISLSPIKLIRSIPYDVGNHLANKEDSRSLGNDNYIILYFNNDFRYSSGFQNDYRNEIDYIKNGDYKKYGSKETFDVKKGLEIEIYFVKAITSLYSFFDSKYDVYMKYLVFVDFTYFNSNSICNMRSLFKGCSSLVSIDISNFDTSKVNNMRSLFFGCSSLVSIDLSNFDTSEVTDMGFMFYGCCSLVSIDLSNFNISKVTDMGDMFCSCSSLVSIDL